MAQLYYGTSAANLIPVTNPPARFRNIPSTDPLAGTWSGGTRTLVGISPGTTAILQVRHWDSDWGRTYEEAATNYAFRQETFTFSYTPPAPGPSPPPPTAFYMEGLRGATPPCPFPFGPPGIVSQPVDQVAYVGQTVILSAVTTNSCVFQWQFNGTNLFAGRWGPLRINNVQLHHQGDYRVIATYPGRPSVTSQVARLTVYPAPQLTSARYDNGAFAFYVSEITGRDVVIETAPDLNPATTWTPVLTNTVPFWFTNSTPADRQRYYRTVFR